MESPEPLAASYSSGSETAWEGLFFVVTALFLGELTTPFTELGCGRTCPTARSSNQLDMFSGIFTKHLLAWTKLPFTGLLLVRVGHLYANLTALQHIPMQQA